MNVREWSAALLLGWFAFEASGAELGVPAPYGSIQAAVDAATAGDTVLVGAGTYEGAIIFKAGVLLRGESADKVIVRSSDYTRPVLSAATCGTGSIFGMTFEYTAPASGAEWPTPAPDVMLLDQSTVEVSGCVVRGGGGHGLVIQGAGQSVVNDCNFEQNGGSGVWVSDDAAPQIRKSKSHDNKYAGIYFAAGSNGMAEENEVWQNGSSGIYVEEAPDTLQLLRNQCHDNAFSGIFIGEKVRAQVLGNQCRNNTTGIGFGSDGEGVRLEDNVCEQNLGAGLDVHSGYAFAAKNNVFWDNGGFSPGGVVLLRENEDFEALDTIVQRTRDEQRRAPEGAWQLKQFYSDCILPHRQHRKEKASVENRGLAHLLKWRETRPESGAARIALAGMYRALGYDCNSGESLDEVREFRRYLNLGWEILQEGGAWAAKDPEWYTTKLLLANGLAKTEATLSERLWSTFITGKPVENEVDKAFREGKSVDRTYFPLYEAKFQTLAGRWSNNPKQVEDFINETAGETRDVCGDTFYARLIRCAAEEYRFDDDMGQFFEDYSFDWARLDAGLSQVCEVSPKSKYWVNYHCWMACLYKKRESAAAIFAKIGEKNWESEVWEEVGRFEIYRQWAVEGKDYPVQGSKLMSAVCDDDLDLVKERIHDNKDEVNFMSDRGEPPVFRAADECQKEILKVLLEAKGDPESKDFRGRSALRRAVEWGCVDGVRMLLDYGANVRTTDSEGAVPLYYAGSEEGTPAIARLLVEHGADVNQGAPKSGTPLMYAVESGNLEVAKVLLELGADRNLANADGVTPLARAKRLKGRSEFVTLLETEGAVPKP